jgi:hypothetical protein
VSVSTNGGTTWAGQTPVSSNNSGATDYDPTAGIGLTYTIPATATVNDEYLLKVQVKVTIDGNDLIDETTPVKITVQ